MEDKKKEKEFAFPIIGQIVTRINPVTNQPDVLAVMQSGMTLRDYFAGQVIGEIAQKVVKTYDWNATKLKLDQYEAQEQLFFSVVARDSYKLADAMLAERSKGHE